MFEVLLNGEIKRSVENITPKKYDNIKVFAADAWYPAADGKIKNLQIVTSNDQSPGDHREGTWLNINKSTNKK